MESSEEQERVVRCTGLKTFSWTCASIVANPSAWSQIETSVVDAAKPREWREEPVTSQGESIKEEVVVCQGLADKWWWLKLWSKCCGCAVSVRSFSQEPWRLGFLHILSTVCFTDRPHKEHKVLGNLKITTPSNETFSFFGLNYSGMVWKWLKSSCPLSLWTTP